jgi:hypothetical protein
MAKKVTLTIPSIKSGNTGPVFEVREGMLWTALERSTRHGRCAKQKALVLSI